MLNGIITIYGIGQYAWVKHFFLLFASLASLSNETLRVGGSLLQAALRLR
jgi:hypothetical protein